jgi:hypothetical protein
MSFSLKEFLPQSADYISSVFQSGDIDRSMHHNFVSTQFVLNEYIPIGNQTKQQLKKTDSILRDRLKYLDNAK